MCSVSNIGICGGALLANSSSCTWRFLGHKVFPQGRGWQCRIHLAYVSYRHHTFWLIAILQLESDVNEHLVDGAVSTSSFLLCRTQKLNYVECRRGRLFDELTAFIIYEMCMENPTATVSFNGKETKEIGNFLITLYASLQSKIVHRFLPLMDAKFDIDRSVTLVDRRKENSHLFLSTPLNCRKGPLGIFEWAQNKLWKYVLIKFDCNFYCLIVASSSALKMVF